MKLIFAVVFVLLVNTVQAQQVFQGSIVYKYRLPQINDAPEITVLYGPNKIKVKFTEKEGYDKTYMLIDLDSEKIFTVNTETKTFFSRKLTGTNSKQTSITKTIAGYLTSSVYLSDSPFGGGGMFGLGTSNTVVLFPASDLYYPIPEKFAGSPALTMIQNNHIVLGVEEKIGGLIDEMPDSLQHQTSIKIEAVKVDLQPLSIVEFSISPDFTKLTWENMKESEVMLVDTVYAQDSSEILPPPPPPKKKSESNPSIPKKTTPTKTEAIKPKKTQTKS